MGVELIDERVAQRMDDALNSISYIDESSDYSTHYGLNTKSQEYALMGNPHTGGGHWMDLLTDPRFHVSRTGKDFDSGIYSNTK